MAGWVGPCVIITVQDLYGIYIYIQIPLCSVGLKVPASRQRVLCLFLPSLPDPCFGEGAGGGHGVPLSSMPRHSGEYCTGLLESVVFPRCHGLPVSTFLEGVGRRSSAQSL